MTTPLGRDTTPKDITVVKTDKIIGKAIASTSTIPYPLSTCRNIHYPHVEVNSPAPTHRNSCISAQGDGIATPKLHDEPLPTMPMHHHRVDLRPHHMMLHYNATLFFFLPLLRYDETVDHDVGPCVILFSSFSLFFDMTKSTSKEAE
jgi:hypothetical protein